MSIYIKANKNLTSIQEYLLDIFSVELSPYQSIFRKAQITYFDIECSIRECHEARRSFEDIVDIVQTNYDDKCTANDIAKGMYNLFSEGKFRGLWCPDVDKIVFCVSSTHGGIWEYKLVSGYGIRTKGLDYKGKGKYSLKEILDLADQKNNYKIN